MNGYEQSSSEYMRADPDIMLDVPVLKVEELSLEVVDLQARVAVRAQVSHLLEVEVSIGIVVDKVKLEASNVEAVALLKARLESVDSMVQRTLSSIDASPGIVGL